jgi:uncharacterized membrane protein YidH (DUF202 family)
VGWLDIATITLISAAVGIVRATLKAHHIRNLTQLQRPRSSMKIALGIAIVFVGLSATTGLKTVQGIPFDRTSSELTPKPTAVQEMPTLTPA